MTKENETLVCIAAAALAAAGVPVGFFVGLMVFSWIIYFFGGKRGNEAAQGGTEE